MSAAVLILLCFCRRCNADQTAGNAAAGKMILSREELAAIDGNGRGVTDCLDGHPLKWNF
ncbi:MAG: hypothetical protein JRF36_00315 [Deltaproteobacteria bacterium]|jgi:hypothetical protein|nr:hypothetical protein [Deltaproteobacteria bacterium]MBW2487074.1 hypothetical protein [Deltaproteobacteria bacterium]MBW2515982.1 hypothetical protein [Deltaproteobacteria bacterium]